MAKVTRGFLGRNREKDPRLPPGQYDTGNRWPVLTAEVTPKLDRTTWTFKVEGLVEQPTAWARGPRSARQMTDRNTGIAGTVAAIRPEAARAKTCRLKLAEPTSHLAAHHSIVRLTAPDVYTASGSYSVSSRSDETDEIELTVE